MKKSITSKRRLKHQFAGQHTQHFKQSFFPFLEKAKSNIQNMSQMKLTQNRLLLRCIHTKTLYYLKWTSLKMTS